MTQASGIRDQGSEARLMLLGYRAAGDPGRFLEELADRLAAVPRARMDLAMAEYAQTVRLVADAGAMGRPMADAGELLGAALVLWCRAARRAYEAGRLRAPPRIYPWQERADLR